MAALTVHFDDSGTHNNSPTVVVAGFIAPAIQWHRFTREWNKAKGEYGFEVFHFAEFLANDPKSEFADTKRWNELYKARALARLRTIAGGRAAHAFSASVSRADYAEIATEEFVEKFGGPFTWVVRAVMGFVEQWREKNNITDPIEYIFDTSDRGVKREIDGVFDGALRHDDPLRKWGIKPGCHSFRDKREILPLQAADLLAGCVYQRDRARIKGVVIPQYVADSFNYFLLKDDRTFFTSRYQSRASLMDLVGKKPRLVHPEDRRPKPTPKGTKPNPPKKRSPAK